MRAVNLDYNNHQEKTLTQPLLVGASYHPANDLTTFSISLPQNQMQCMDRIAMLNFEFEKSGVEISGELIQTTAMFINIVFITFIRCLYCTP